MVRFFFGKDEVAESARQARREGAAAVARREVRWAARLAGLAPGETALAAAQFHHEEWAYARLEPGAGVTAAAVAVWAADPGEGLCFASEGFALAHRGWMGGAVDAATSCLRGLLREYFTDEQIDGWWSGCLSVDSCRNECLLLPNERDLRDIATGGHFSRQCREAEANKA